MVGAKDAKEPESPQRGLKNHVRLVHGNLVLGHTVKCLGDVNSRAASQSRQLPESSLSPVVTAKARTGKEPSLDSGG